MKKLWKNFWRQVYKFIICLVGTILGIGVFYQIYTVNNYQEGLLLYVSVAAVLISGGCCLGACKALIEVMLFLVLTIARSGDYDKKKVESELADITTKVFEKEQIYFTQNYIVFASAGINVIEYKNLLWAHQGSLSTNFWKMGTFVYLVIYNSKRKKFKTHGIDVNKLNSFREILDELSRRNPKMMIGYSVENRKAYLSGENTLWQAKN